MNLYESANILSDGSFMHQTAAKDTKQYASSLLVGHCYHRPLYESIWILMQMQTYFQGEYVPSSSSASDITSDEDDDIDKHCRVEKILTSLQQSPLDLLASILLLLYQVYFPFLVGMFILRFWSNEANILSGRICTKQQQQIRNHRLLL